MENDKETFYNDSLDIKNVIADIESIEGNKNFCQNIKVFLIKSKNKSNEIYKQNCEDETKRILIDSLKEEMNKTQFKGRNIIPYDILVNKKNTHELVTTSDYPNIVEELNKINDTNEELPNTKKLNEKDFDLYMVKLKAHNNYKIFGSFSGMLKLKKKFLFGKFEIGNFNDSKIKFSAKDNIVGFSKKIDLLVINDRLILINQADSKFESLFKMNQVFYTKASNILDENKKIQKIFSEKTREKLKKKIKYRKTMATKLIKYTSDEKRFNETVSKISKITEITAESNKEFYDKVKDVKYENGQLTVEDGKEAQLINALSDSLYTAYISETVNVDESRT
ncbi:MAG: hypothetical protein ACRC1X_07570 [Lactobacillus panisapium]